MKKLALIALSLAALSSTAFAVDLTGTAAMSASDLDKTQQVLMSQKTGAVTSWYNIDTTTHFDIKVGRHYSLDQRPCVAYNVTVKHNSTTKDSPLNACLDYDNNWIANAISMR